MRTTGNYLSRAEKLNIITITGFAEWLDDYLPYVKDKDIRKWLKTAQTFLRKAWQKRLEDTDSYSEATSIIRMARQYQIEFRPKYAPDSKADDLYALAEIAQFNTCLTCTEKGGECELKSILKKIGIPETNSHECPYDIWGDMRED